MKKVLRFGFWAFLLLVSACSDDETPFPTPNVRFTIDVAVPEVGIPIMFNNLTRNADRYEWDFDVLTTPMDTSTSPTVTFDSPGDVTVTLRAFTADGQVDSTSQTITIRQRFLTNINITSVPFLDPDGDPWDVFQKDSVVFDTLMVKVDSIDAPDLVVILSPQDDPTSGIGTPILVNPELPLGLTLDVPFQLTDEIWSLGFFDFDGPDLENPQNDDFVVMANFTLNPVQFGATFIDSENLNGLITISSRGFGIDLFFDFQ